MRPFGSGISGHKAIGLVLLGAKSFNVLIDTQEGGNGPYLCNTAASVCISRCSVQVQILFGGPGPAH